MSMNSFDQDPWSKPGNNSKGQDQTPPNQHYTNNPPDLEEVFNNLLKKIKGNNGLRPNSPRSNQPMPWKKALPLAIAAGIGFWVATGFYTIKEADRGVVLQFGKLHSIVQPGLNWKPNFIRSVIPVNVEQVRELRTSGAMLTQDENMVKVEMTVQYRVEDPAKYLFSVTNANESLMQATDSALRYVIGNMKMDEILTTGRSIVRERTWKAIEEIIEPYKMGLGIVDVNFQSARPPEEVKAAFDDAIKAQEDEQRYIREAEAYAREKEPIARGNAKRILESANAYKEQVVLDAQGEVARYQRLLPEYLADPKLLRERIYLQTMEEVMAKTPKVMMENGNNLTVLPMEQLLSVKKTPTSNNTQKTTNTYQESVKQLTPMPDTPTTTDTTTRTGRFH